MTECLISFPGPVSKATLSRLIVDYMKYILYYRGQFPLPLDQLTELLIKSQDFTSTAHKDAFIGGHRVYHDLTDCKDVPDLVPRSSIPLNRTKQNFMNSISKFDNLFNELLQILETNSVLEIVLNLGPNIMNPKEMYRITLPVQCSMPECNTDFASLKKCKLKFFQKVIHSDLWADLKTDTLLPISVLLLLEKGVALKENMEQKSFYSFPKSCKQRIVCFSDKCDHVDVDSISCNGVTLTDSPVSAKCVQRKGVWVKLKPDLKGFKSFSENQSRSCTLAK